MLRVVMSAPVLPFCESGIGQVPTIAHSEVSVPAPISILIPTLNSETDLRGCLASLTQGLGDGLIRELVIADGGSSDQTDQLADAIGANFVVAPASRGGQLRRGANEVRGDWLMVVHADSVLQPGWTGPVREHMRDHPNSAGYFQLTFDARGLMPLIVAGWANLRSRLFGLPFGDQGLLLPIDIYRNAGGYADQPLMEDVALARALRRQGVALKPLPVTITTSAARYKRRGWLRAGFSNLMTQVRYFCGADPNQLSRQYHR
jgi:rSAM/selenodomain-associated transferase 2